MSDEYGENDWIRLTEQGKQDRRPISDDPNQARAERVITTLLAAAGDEGLPYELLVQLSVAVDTLIVEELQLDRIRQMLEPLDSEGEDDDVQP